MVIKHSGIRHGLPCSCHLVMIVYILFCCGLLVRGFLFNAELTLEPRMYTLIVVQVYTTINYMLQ